jgi:hypothetical protein
MRLDAVDGVDPSSHRRLRGATQTNRLTQPAQAGLADPSPML